MNSIISAMCPLYDLMKHFNYECLYNICVGMLGMFCNDCEDKHEQLPALDYNLIKLIVVSIMIVLCIIPAELVF